MPCLTGLIVLRVPPSVLPYFTTLSNSNAVYLVDSVKQSLFVLDRDPKHVNCNELVKFST